MIDQFLRYFIPGLNEHLSDDRLASLFCDELTLAERLIARRHIAKCWRCRFRQEDLEGRRADEVLSVYREAFNRRDLKLPPEPRKEFARRLELHLQQLPPRRWWNVRLPKFSLANLSPMSPTLAVCGVFGFAIVVSMALWWQQRVPEITSNALLVRAERWDSSNLSSAPAVVYQSVRITSPKLVMDRAIYRDLQGKRIPRLIKLAEKQENLKVQLARAGVDWDQPISASDYQAWHDHQHERIDKITRAGTHLLRLTTTVPDSSVSAQSITVRDTDFHPVRRTVDLPDIGTVVIAELDFKILPLSAVGADIFEPLGGSLNTGLAGRARVLPFPRLPQVVTQEQLDESELNARLILNQLHADSGEQLEIHRQQQEVLVDGVVETTERKRELEAQLRLVPHVRVSIQSAADLKNVPAGTGPTEVQTASMPDRPSPLTVLLEKHGRSVGDINVLAERLFNTALTIGQESNAILDLQTRFLPNAERTIVASATLSNLIYSHHERLEAALKRERALIAEAQITPEVEAVSHASSSSLSDAADRNLALSKELTQTNSPATRRAEQILAEMSASIEDLTTAANAVYGKSQSASVLSGKK